MEHIASRRLSRRAFYWLTPAAIGSFAAFAGLTFWEMTTTFGSPSLALRHLASAPSCETARAAGITPAHKGRPGYWRWHDEDGDGIACEPR